MDSTESIKEMTVIDRQLQKAQRLPPWTIDPVAFRCGDKHELMHSDEGPCPRQSLHPCNALLSAPTTHFFPRDTQTAL